MTTPLNPAHLLLFCLLASASNAGESVKVRRIPGGGLQPRVVVGSDNVQHLVYFRGKAEAGDIYYVRSSDSGKTFSKGLRVNTESSSALAIGTIRGAQIALGKSNRIHIAWNGRSRNSSHHGAPMLYSRLNEAGSTFEPQRNLMTKTTSLDGGGSVAADGVGNVYVVWHANESSGPREEARRAVWVAKSTDEGRTFAPEIRANVEDTGACGCCGLSAFADSEARLYVLYRTATKVLSRDMRLLVSTDRGITFRGSRIDSWKVPKCIMSQASFEQAPQGILGAWETKEEVYFGQLGSQPPFLTRKIKASGTGVNRKHPALASNSRGETLLVWTEGTGWNRGGALAWQLYDPNGTPIERESGRRDGLAAWSFPAVVANPDDKFVIYY